MLQRVEKKTSSKDSGKYAPTIFESLIPRELGAAKLSLTSKIVDILSK
jgi:chemotaxis receptor (MCP) glutamine deamidase CheD